MGYKAELKQHIKVGAEIVAVYQGRPYTGTVVKYENTAIQDAVLTLEDKAGLIHIIPISVGMFPAITVLLVEKNKTDDIDGEIDEEYDLTDDKTVNAEKIAESELINYNTFDDSQLIRAAKKKNIELSFNGKKRKRKELIKLLAEYDKKQLKKK